MVLSDWWCSETDDPDSVADGISAPDQTYSASLTDAFIKETDLGMAVTGPSLIWKLLFRTERRWIHIVAYRQRSTGGGVAGRAVA